jgi:hypothetical protein
MDTKAHTSTATHGTSSLYGFDLLEYVRNHAYDGSSAYDAAVFALTHGGACPQDQAEQAIGLFDLAALRQFREQSSLPLQARDDNSPQLALFINSLGRLHIRPADESRPVYAESDSWHDIGYVSLTAELYSAIDTTYRQLQQQEDEATQELRTALAELESNGELGRVVTQVMDHIQHVESVCFYVRDRFFALIDRYVNLIDDKRASGYLTGLQDKALKDWSSDDVVIVAALHALFISGRSVRFEEFNGVLLTAHRLIERLHELADSYRSAGCLADIDNAKNIFHLAQLIRSQTLQSQGKPWLRYRFIYGLTFQKNERILPSTHSSEDVDTPLEEFVADYRDLVSKRVTPNMTEYLLFSQLASACLSRDIAGLPCTRSSGAAAGWIEYLMERIVASAVKATQSDYGMSSSLRDLSRLVVYEEGALSDAIHKLTPSDFYTCVVTSGLLNRFGDEEANMIATSVQKRMMFNRWHFIPGNLDREQVQAKRHWYYPPLIPDIAIHSDMHRAAHNRARVKYSIRAPGPDMSRPPLQIAGHNYRGFYDIRLVRMEGEPFTVEDLLRARRRTLWLEPVFHVLASYLASTHAADFQIRGFAPGQYLDLPGHQSGQLDQVELLAE